MSTATERQLAARHYDSNAAAFTKMGTTKAEFLSAFDTGQEFRASVLKSAGKSGGHAFAEKAKSASDVDYAKIRDDAERQILASLKRPPKPGTGEPGSGAGMGEEGQKPPAGQDILDRVEIPDDEEGTIHTSDFQDLYDPKELEQALESERTNLPEDLQGDKRACLVAIWYDRNRQDPRCEGIAKGSFARSVLMLPPRSRDEFLEQCQADLTGQTAEG